MPRNELFPAIEPFESGWLKVDPQHRIYWEQSGNPQGIPVVFLHGGPGAGASSAHRRFFDPGHYRIVILDQRGAGRSTPLGEIQNNTTDHLVSDLEALRDFLHIDRWHVFGGSWGSTLALAYAQTHPDRCVSLVLRGIFLMRLQEINWFLYDMRTIYPEAWSTFTAILAPEERGDILEAYWRRLTATDPATCMTAARLWSGYEGACSTLLPSPEIASAAEQSNHALGLSRMEAHYFRNNRFTPEDRLLRNVARIRHIPAVIVQGRYDIICPIVSADELHRAWPEADYVVVPNAGHSAMEPGIRSALVTATERFKTLPL
ncbi:MAG: prolyl aminopeptidase [Azospirillaceae bacterium]|nr:prolyl aminopeptidase [Azospirillaceae bacterium]